MVVANIDSSYAALIFAIIYLLYPSTSKAVFDMFRCRAVDPVAGLWLLESDYREQCWTGTHIPFAAVGVFFFLLYPLGVPLVLGSVLWWT